MLLQKDQPRSKPVLKTTHSLASPFPEPSWYVLLQFILNPKTSRPQIQLDDQQTIQDLLCMLLAELGQHRRSTVVSKGKRRKRENRKQENDEEATNPSQPEIKSHVLIGFNAVQRHLEAMILEKAHVKADESQTSSKETSTDAGDDIEGSATDNNLVALFVDRSSQPLIMTRHLPNMMAAAVSKGSSLWLVTLPSGAGTRLGETVGIPRLGFCGLLAKAPGSIPLLHYIKEHIQPVQPSMADVSLSAHFLPLKVKTYTVEMESNLSGKMKRQQQKLALDGDAGSTTRQSKRFRRRKRSAKSASLTIRSP